MSEITIVENPPDNGRPLREGMISITTTMPKAKLDQFHAFMHSDTFEKAEALRKASCRNASSRCASRLTGPCINCSGANTFARLLASMYNGNRVQFDASRLLFSLDSENFEHAMNAIRLCHETSREPHTFFQNGGALFEKMIGDWGFEEEEAEGQIMSRRDRRHQKRCGTARRARSRRRCS